MVLRLICMCTYCVWQTWFAMHLSLSRNEEFLRLEHKWQLYFEAKEDEAKTRGRVHRTWYVQTLARLSIPMSCVNSSHSNSYHKNKARKRHKGNAIFFPSILGTKFVFFCGLCLWLFVALALSLSVQFSPSQYGNLLLHKSVFYVSDFQHVLVQASMFQDISAQGSKFQYVSEQLSTFRLFLYKWDQMSIFQYKSVYVSMFQYKDAKKNKVNTSRGCCSFGYTIRTGELSCHLVIPCFCFDWW